MCRYRTLFITDRSPYHQAAALAAAPAALEVVMVRNPSRDALLQQLPGTHFLISERAGVIDGELIAAAPELRLIQRLGSLTYDIDLAAATARNIPVCAWPLKGCVMVAEHMLLQMLALVKRVAEVKAIAEAAADWDRPSRRTDENTFAYNWSNRQAIQGIYQTTVGILGFGEIGAELARRLRPFAPTSVLYHKRQRLPATLETELGINYAEPPQIIAQSDFLCCLLPFTETTELSLNATTLAQMKPGAYLVNCGSGSVIDETALAAAIERGQLGGAALDTFEWEPIRPDNPLLPLARQSTANVLLTPHTAAGAATTSSAATRNSDYTNIEHFLANEPLHHRVA